MRIEGVMLKLWGERLVDVAAGDNGLEIGNAWIFWDSRFSFEDAFAEGCRRDVGLDRMLMRRLGGYNVLGRSWDPPLEELEEAILEGARRILHGLARERRQSSQGRRNCHWEQRT